MFSTSILLILKQDIPVWSCSSLRPSSLSELKRERSALERLYNKKQQNNDGHCLLFHWEEFSTAVNGQFLTLVSSSPFSGAANFGCKPEIVGRKKGAAFGTLGGSLGLFLIYDQNKNILSQLMIEKWLFSLSPSSPYIPIHSLYGIFLICDPSTSISMVNSAFWNLYKGSIWYQDACIQ